MGRAGMESRAMSSDSWSHHGMLYLELKTEVPGKQEGRPGKETRRCRRWRLDKRSFEKQEFKERLELTTQAWKLRKELRKTDPNGWWEKLKRKLKEQSQALNGQNGGEM